MLNVILHAAFLIVCLACVTALPAFVAAENPAATLPERCRITPPERGDCKALFEVYSFNPETNSCDASNYGGCGGTVPFSTEEECRKTCETGERLRLKGIKAEGQLPYFRLNLEYPRNWGDPAFTVTVDGKAVQPRWRSGGASGKTAMSSFAVFSGDSGLKNIVITANIKGTEHRVAARHYIHAPEMAVLLDRSGDNEALFEKTALRFFIHQTDTPRILLNGQRIEAAVERSERGTIVTVRPEWQPSMNKVVLEATGRSGKQLKKEFSFVYFADVRRSEKPASDPSFPTFSSDYAHYSNIKLSTGDRITLSYGHMGSKSGPFYTVGASARILSIRETDMTGIPAYIISDDGWLMQDAHYLWEIIALQPGTANLELSVKKHFRGAYELEKVIEITVVPKP